MRQQSGDLGVALVGSGFMGIAHSQGWRTAPRVFELPLKPVMRVLCDRLVTVFRPDGGVLLCPEQHPVQVALLRDLLGHLGKTFRQPAFGRSIFRAGTKADFFAIGDAVSVPWEANGFPYRVNLCS